MKTGGSEINKEEREHEEENQQRLAHEDHIPY
jgi:hypothetical protein